MPAVHIPTGVTHYDPGASYNGFTCYTAPDGQTRLIDMNGTVRRRWPHPGLPARLLDPALCGGRRGDVLLQTSNAGDHRTGIFGNRAVGQLTWDGETVWEWGAETPEAAARQNHDWQRLPDGSTLLLVTVPRVVADLGPWPVGDQGIQHIAADGTRIWTWLAGDHLHELGLSDAGFADLRASARADPDDPWGYLEINSMSTLGPNQWHERDPHGPFAPENIIISSRTANVVAVLDRHTGSVVWRLGPYAAEGPGDHHRRILRDELPRPVDQLSGQHHAHLIGPGLPGAGNLLVFDNQGGAGYPPAPLGIFSGSRVLEIDPTTRDIVWQYTAASSGLPVWTFSSSFVGGAQRLPNGNTLITEGAHGRLFQVRPDGEIVWEYLTPFAAPVGEGTGRTTSSLIYRAQTVPYEWAPEGVPHTQDPVLPQ